MTLDEQLDLWVEGYSIHNKRGLSGEIVGECCPDFSCCRPQLLAPKEIRIMFRNARRSGNESLEMRMLGEFLSKMFADAAPEKKIYIVGQDLRREGIE